MTKQMNNTEKAIHDMIRRVEKSLRYAPPGYLALGTTHGRPQMTQVVEADAQKEVTYIRKNQIELAERLAQKSYHQAVLKECQRMLEELEKASPTEGYIGTNVWMEERLRAIYDNLSDQRKQLVVPVLPPNDEFVANWLAQEYEPLGFDPDDESEYYTIKGERVRSRAEMIVGDLLYRLRLPYLYEPPLRLQNREVRPDFLILHPKTHEVFVFEHFGLMDSASYADRNVGKIMDYLSAGWSPKHNLIMYFETRKHPFRIKQIEQLIREYLDWWE